MRRRSQHEHHHRSQNLRPAFPHVQHAVGLGMNKDPDYPRHTSSSPPTRMTA
ncbi:MAG: mandelate racemase [Bifidobacterium bifidum]|nr:mandelate racemase [Bifidobacterium bifidum]